MSVQANPFRRRTIFIMFAVGFLAFVGLLYGLGTGDPSGSGKNGQAHGASNSVVGFKALATLLEKTGTAVQYSRTAGGMDNPGLLVLTPPPFTDPDDLAQVVQDRSYIGPTMIILPKWQVMTSPTLKAGWVQRLGVIGDDSGESMLKEIADVEITVADAPADKKAVAGPQTRAAKASSAVGPALIRPDQPVTIAGDYIRSIVRDPQSGQALIAYLDDGGVYPPLDGLDESRIADEEEIDESYFPLVIVADADLMNNNGMANEQKARHALALITAAATGSNGDVTFDLTFNGLGANTNLLTLAFEPPFLSATVCLIIAAMAAAWMAFNRFGPPVRDQRSIDFGKTALVNNSAGFIKRMQREYLVAEPYADLIRDQATAAIGLPPDTDDQIVRDRLDALGEFEGNRFTALLHRLRTAHNAQETVEGAAALHQWKKDKIG